MEIRIANFDEYDEELSEFRKIGLETLKKIEPKWAYGENLDKVYDYSQHPAIGGYKILNVFVKDLIENVEFYDFDVMKLFSDEISSDYRVVSTLKRWMNNEFVDPPTLTLNVSDEKKLSISDGRHRFKISVFLKLEMIPVAIHYSLIESIGKIIKLQEI